MEENFETTTEETPIENNMNDENDTADDTAPGESEFYFESDHLALRGNADYSALLRTIVILEAQRIQVTKDIDQIALAEKMALDDPEGFLKRLSRGEQLDLPGPINIIEIPKINFEKYNVTIPNYPDSCENADGSKGDGKVNDITVRGRLFDQSKPETFNQLWTSDEQRRLEELLVEYPPEPIEMRRFAKIAKALGNRTTKQVASRVQKFFKKLYSAGMPIPGRLPKNHRDYKSYRSLKHQYRTSTFFPANDVPVIMPEDDDYNPVGAHPNRMSYLNFHHTGSSTNSITVDQGSDEDQSETREVKILKLIQRVRNDKEKYGDHDQIEHYGYKCDFCGADPIIGTRWHCITCTQASVDFCSDCLVTQAMDGNHTHSVSHQVIGIRISSAAENLNGKPNDDLDSDCSDMDEYFPSNVTVREEGEESNSGSTGQVYDKDYMFAKSNGYNYLDPNFMPE